MFPSTFLPAALRRVGGRGRSENLSPAPSGFLGPLYGTLPLPVIFLLDIFFLSLPSIVGIIFPNLSLLVTCEDYLGCCKMPFGPTPGILASLMGPYEMETNWRWKSSPRLRTARAGLGVYEIKVAGCSCHGFRTSPRGGLDPTVYFFEERDH